MKSYSETFYLTMIIHIFEKPYRNEYLSDNVQ